MHKYHFNIITNDSGNNAGTKATEDCRSILIENGFIDVQINFKKALYLLPLNLLKLVISLITLFFKIKNNSFVVVQYPLKGINRYFKYFIRLSKIKHCKIACIVHDLDSLRAGYDAVKIINEIKSLSAYDAVIAHNPAMSAWLKKQGYNGHIEEIELFDYLVPENQLNSTEPQPLFDNVSKPEIVFAGNLSRGNFLPELIKANTFFKLNLYGSGFDKQTPPTSNLKWYGSFSSTQIVSEIKGNFGLVWDGESITDITGIMGEYLRINTPHKTSLYLVAGLPIIISEHAAMAAFVRKNKIGICIKGIGDLQNLHLTTTATEYKQMILNVQAIRNRLVKGFYLQNAISRVQSYLS